MPDPQADESESDFVERCIPIVIDDGTAEDGSQAAAVCHSMYRKAKGMQDDHSTYLLDNFVTVRPGEAYRLFPFGVIVKGGRRREITPEFAARFRLPHFKPPVKLGSHDDTTPAGGHIVGLEVRADGLYAIPEFNDRGAQALADGAYRYQSPEVIWEDGALEDPVTGKLIPGPLIIGDALLHTPHLGEAAALYSVEGANIMTIENVQVPKNLWDKFVTWFERRATEPETEPAVRPAPEVPEEFKAAVIERDSLKAKLASMEAERLKAERLTAIRAEFNMAEFGAAFVDLGKAANAVDTLATMTDDQRAWVLTQFKALSAQIKESNITGELGSSNPNELAGADKRQVLDATIKARAAELKVDYNTALVQLAREKPELFKV